MSTHDWTALARQAWKKWKRQKLAMAISITNEQPLVDAIAAALAAAYRQGRESMAVKVVRATPRKVVGDGAMTNSLAALLAVVERWQTRTIGTARHAATVRELQHFDLAVLRAAAHQHAEALREVAGNQDYMDSQADADAVRLRAAADFLDGSDE